MQITTYSQLKDTRSILETLLGITGSNLKFNKVLKDSSLSDDVTKKLEVGDSQSRKKMIEDQLDKLSVFKIIEITLSFTPKDSTIEKINDIISKENYVADLIIDKSILGGIIVNHEGKYKDLSLRKKIDKYSKGK